LNNEKILSRIFVDSEIGRFFDVSKCDGHLSFEPLMLIAYSQHGLHA
jgi:hypothetical protein